MGSFDAGAGVRERVSATPTPMPKSIATNAETKQARIRTPRPDEPPCVTGGGGISPAMGDGAGSGAVSGGGCEKGPGSAMAAGSVTGGGGGAKGSGNTGSGKGAMGSGKEGSGSGGAVGGAGKTPSGKGGAGSGSGCGWICCSCARIISSSTCLGTSGGESVKRVNGSGTGGGGGTGARYAPMPW